MNLPGISGMLYNYNIFKYVCHYNNKYLPCVPGRTIVITWTGYLVLFKMYITKMQYTYGNTKYTLSMLIKKMGIFSNTLRNTELSTSCPVYVRKGIIHFFFILAYDYKFHGTKVIHTDMYMLFLCSLNLLVA